jgi:hypothetical protein
MKKKATKFAERGTTWLKGVSPVNARLGFKDRRLVFEIQLPSKTTKLLEEQLEKPLPPKKAPWPK